MGECPPMRHPHGSTAHGGGANAQGSQARPTACLACYCLGLGHLKVKSPEERRYISQVHLGKISDKRVPKSTTWCTREDFSNHDEATSGTIVLGCFSCGDLDGIPLLLYRKSLDLSLRLLLCVQMLLDRTLCYLYLHPPKRITF